MLPVPWWVWLTLGVGIAIVFIKVAGFLYDLEHSAR